MRRGSVQLEWLLAYARTYCASCAYIESVIYVIVALAASRCRGPVGGIRSLE